MATWVRSMATKVKLVVRSLVRKVKVRVRSTLVRMRLQQTDCMEDSVSQIVMVIVSKMKGQNQVQVGAKDLLLQDRERTFQLLPRKSTLDLQNLPETSTMPSWTVMVRRVRVILKYVRSLKGQKRSQEM